MKRCPNIVKDPKQSTLNSVVVEEDKVSEIKIRMGQINVTDQIHFHKHTSKVLYSNLLHSTLNTKKSQAKVEKLKELKKEKGMRKAWQT